MEKLLEDLNKMYKQVAELDNLMRSLVACEKQFVEDPTEETVNEIQEIEAEIMERYESPPDFPNILASIDKLIQKMNDW